MRAATLVEPPSWRDGSRGIIKKKVNETDYNYFELFSLIICPVSNHTSHIVGGFSKITRNKPLKLVCFVFPMKFSGDFSPLSVHKLCVHTHGNKT